MNNITKDFYQKFNYTKINTIKKNLTRILKHYISQNLLNLMVIH